MKSKEKMARLEHYMEFLENPHTEELTVSQLNQIIFMHGFKRLHHQPKKVLLDTLNTIEDLHLINPFRSTLKETISSSAPLTTEDVVNDLDLLDWKECLLQSIQTINGSNAEELGTTSNTSVVHQEDVFGRGRGFKVNNGFPISSKRKRNSRRKIRSVTALCLAPPLNTSSAWYH